MPGPFLFSLGLGREKRSLNLLFQIHGALNQCFQICSNMSTLHIPTIESGEVQKKSKTIQSKGPDTSLLIKHSRAMILDMII